MAVITISRQFGAGGKTLGEMIAKNLDYLFLDDQIIQELAKKANVSENWVKSVERTAGGTISRFFSSALSSDYIERLIGADKGYIDENIYIDKLNEVINEFARQDKAVVLGRGGQYILSDFEGAFHIMLVADKEDRVQFLQHFYQMSPSKAEQAVSQGEKRRSNLYKKMGKKNYNDPNHYHLVLNMSKVSLEKAVDLITDLIQP